MKNIPIYQVIENDIKHQIKNGLLQQGDMIPSENELKEKYNVSRMTVRQALNDLVNEGYVYKHKGKGTFVNSVKIDKKIQGLISFTEEMNQMNRKVTNKIISIDLIPADEEVSAKLFLNKDELVYLVERIRYGDDIPVLFEQLYVPYRLFKVINEDIMDGSFYQYIEEELHLKINYSIQTIEARLATNEIADYLGISKTAPVLHISLNSFLDNGRPFEYVKSYYRADQYRFIQHAVR
ncbi:GntR family transcriptional regulator [Mycoplasmatota bacterium]|nr:GntR family transcriptional regulator [Mycoplasmatota bacterium]